MGPRPDAAKAVREPRPLRGTAGLLLAGGRSQRFGAEKAVAAFRGRLLMDAVADRFAGCARVAVSARRDSAAARHAQALGWEVLYDDAAHPEGPLAGINAGLKWASVSGQTLLAVAPCDAPLLPPQVFAALARALGQASAVYAVTERGPHPLCAIWRVSLLAPLSAALDAGAHPAVRDFLDTNAAAQLRFAHAASFANFNTPASLAATESAE